MAMEKKEPSGPKPAPIERTVPTDLKPIYVTGATGEVTRGFGMIQFHLDRPIFKLDEDNKSYVEKVQREVLVELHMAPEIWKSIGSLMTTKARQFNGYLQAPSVPEDRFEQRKKWITDFDAARSEIRATHVLDMEDPKVIGKGYPPAPEPERIPSEAREAYFGLERSINRIWTEARMSYVYGFFQSSTFLIGALLELLIEQFLRLKKVWPQYEFKYVPKRRWLGTLIEFCETKELLDDKTLKNAYAINDLRIKAVHMETEKKKVFSPPDEHPLVEPEDVSQVEAGLEEISVEAPTQPGETLMLDLSDPNRPVWKRLSMYKPQAREAFRLLSEIFWSLRCCQSTD
jgi:hypothetical protein